MFVIARLQCAVGDAGVCVGRPIGGNPQKQAATAWRGARQGTAPPLVMPTGTVFPNRSRAAWWPDSPTDCNDTDPTIFPGAPLACDGKDHNCDMMVDGLRFRSRQRRLGWGDGL